MGIPAPPLKIQTHWINDQSYPDQGNVRLLAVHTAEGALTDESLGDFMDRVGNVSYHDGCDDESLTRYVVHTRSAWALRGGNKISLNLCTVGFAKWTRAQWLEHTPMLKCVAWWLEKESWDHKIPLRKLDPSETGKAVQDPSHSGGVIGHIDYTQGTGDGTHWDPGYNFPWDYVMSAAQEHRRERNDDSMAGIEGTEAEILAKIKKAVWTDVEVNTTSGGELSHGKAAEYNYNRIARLGDDLEKMAADIEAILTKVNTLGANPGGGATLEEVQTEIQKVMDNLSNFKLERSVSND